MDELKKNGIEDIIGSDEKVIKVADAAVPASDKLYKVITIEPIRFVASYGQYDRTFQKRIDLIVPTDANGAVKQHIFQFAGSMHKNKFTFMASDPEVKGVVLSAQLDVSSAAYETPKVKWSARTDFFEIPESAHHSKTFRVMKTSGYIRFMLSKIYSNKEIRYHNRIAGERWRHYLPPKRHPNPSIRLLGVLKSTRL